MCPGPGFFCHAICAALRRAVLHLLAADVGPSSFISCALHCAEMVLLQDMSCDSAAESSCAWPAVQWGSVQGLHLHGAAHVQPGPIACKSLACSLSVRGWVEGGCIWALPQAAIIYENWRTVHRKKLAEGALPTTLLLAVTCRARVCSVQRRCAAVETCLCMPRECVRACEQRY